MYIFQFICTGFYILIFYPITLLSYSPSRLPFIVIFIKSSHLPHSSHLISHLFPISSPIHPNSFSSPIHLIISQSSYHLPFILSSPIHPIFSSPIHPIFSHSSYLLIFHSSYLLLVSSPHNSSCSITLPSGINTLYSMYMFPNKSSWSRTIGIPRPSNTSTSPSRTIWPAPLFNTILCSS